MLVSEYSCLIIVGRGIYSSRLSLCNIGIKGTISPLSIIASGVASLIITLSISFSALQFIEIADSVIEISHSLLHGGVPVDNPHLFKTLY